MNRRKFCEQAVTKVSVIALGSMGLLACADKKESSSSSEESTAVAPANDLDVDSCDDLSKVSAEEIKKRESLGYEETTPIPDKQCSSCNLYIPPKEGKSCGGCILFKGPVYEDAYCTYWAPQV